MVAGEPLAARVAAEPAVAEQRVVAEEQAPAPAGRRTLDQPRDHLSHER